MNLKIKMRRKLNEGRSQIKRKYGDYSNIRVNEKAPIRNKIVNFIGKRFVTEEELKSELTKLTEDTGKAFDERQWFKRNQRYFESFENRGQKVWTLSKYGKRVLEFINKPKENPVTENRCLYQLGYSSINCGPDRARTCDFRFMRAAL